MNILIVEDDQNLSKSVSLLLKNESYNVSCALNGKEAMKYCDENNYDIVLLDFNLPDINGLEVYAHYNQIPHMKKCKTVFFSTEDDVDFQVKVLMECADDYIVKPISPKLLLAKIKKVYQAIAVEPTSAWIVQFIPEEHDASLAGKKLGLTRTEYSILKVLVSDLNKPVHRDQLIDIVRGKGFSITPRIIDFQVCNLRKKLGEHGEFLETVRGIGYRLVCRD